MMNTPILYRSTRGDAEPVTASRAILQGLAPDGGLYVPVHFPELPLSLRDFSGMNYRECALEVMKPFLSDFTEEELRDCIDAAYDEKFDTPEIAPLKEVGGFWHLELFHGPTIAFKDMALSLLPHLMTAAAKKNGIKEEIVILTATSGDTGKAAMAGFADVPGTRIIVFYPKNGVSPVQERQMLTQRGENTLVAGIRGNFDDAQSGVKEIFSDPAMREELAEKGFRFSSANSINIGRLVPQIAYYVWSYAQLLKNGVIAGGEEIVFTVPTGNFGNILAGYYASRMGVPVAKLVCASNVNRVLYDFFRTGTYDRNREFFVTSSPSMDILVSSNLERLIYHSSGDCPVCTAQRMNDLRDSGLYSVTAEMIRNMDLFAGYYTDEAGTAETIRSLRQSCGYICDTHTAVAAHAARQFRTETGDHHKTVIVSTASPYKFTRAVMTALGGECAKTDAAGDQQDFSSSDDFALADELCRISGVPVPQAVEEIRNAPVRHHTVCGPDEMRDVIRGFLERA